MKKSLCAFSSNFRPLYIGDIYKVLSMPKRYIVHFRYKKKYVDDEILRNPNNYENQYITIFFTDINNEKKSTTNYSVRKARIKKIEIDSNTELVHLYMSLEEFVNTELSDDIQVDSLPTNKYLVPLKFKNQEETNWKEKIEDLNQFFPGFSFFYLHSLTTTKGKLIKLKHRDDKQRSYYNLTQGYDYLLKVSLGNPMDTKAMIKILPSSNDVSLNCETPLSITARYDEYTIPTHLKSLNVSLENSFITLGPILEKVEKTEYLKEYQCNLEIQKNLGIWNALKFGIATLLAVLTIWVIKDHSKSIWNINTNYEINYVLLAACLILLFSTSYLFHKFNKK